MVKCSSKDLSPYEITEFEKSVSNLQIEPLSATVDDSLGLLTIKNIASGLNITEKDVISLIDTGR